MSVKEKEKMSLLDELKKLDEQRAKLIAGAKEEALKKAETAVADLNALGFSYSLIEGEAVKAKKTGITRQRDPNKPCSYCGEVGHDARFHRGEIIAAKKAAQSKSSKR